METQNQWRNPNLFALEIRQIRSVKFYNSVLKWTDVFGVIVFFVSRLRMQIAFVQDFFKRSIYSFYVDFISPAAPCLSFLLCLTQNEKNSEIRQFPKDLNYFDCVDMLSITNEVSFVVTWGSSFFKTSFCSLWLTGCDSFLKGKEGIIIS